MVRATDLGQMGRSLVVLLTSDRAKRDAADDGVAGVALPTPHFAQERRDGFLAGLEIAAPEFARVAILRAFGEGQKSRAMVNP